MIEHTEILKVFKKVREVTPQNLAEKIHLLDIWVLQYDLISESRHLRNMQDQIVKFIQDILPDVDTEDWLINLFREDPVSAVRLSHAIIATLKIEEYPFLKKIPYVSSIMYFIMNPQVQGLLLYFIKHLKRLRKRSIRKKSSKAQIK